MFDELTPPYATIVADPPWQAWGGANCKGDPAKHYSTMSFNDIRSMPVSDLAGDSAHLWLWCCNRIMEDGYRVVRAWGFQPVSLVTWCKPGPGVGYYLRNNTEHCIFATRGKPMVPEDKPLSTWFQWPRGPHSAKPDGFMDIVEKVSPPPIWSCSVGAPGSVGIRGARDTKARSHERSHEGSRAATSDRLRRVRRDDRVVV